MVGRCRVRLGCSHTLPVVLPPSSDVQVLLCSGLNDHSDMYIYIIPNLCVTRAAHEQMVSVWSAMITARNDIKTQWCFMGRRFANRQAHNFLVSLPYLLKKLKSNPKPW